jgi:hypothetical protein
MRKKSNLSLNRPKQIRQAKEKTIYNDAKKSTPRNLLLESHLENKDHHRKSYNISNSPFRCTAKVKRKFSKSPYTPKSSLSRSTWLSSPRAKRNKTKATRALFDRTSTIDTIPLAEEHDDAAQINSNSDNMDCNEERESPTEELIKLAPKVLENLSKNGEMDKTILNFFRLVHQHKFPLSNISFLLWAEVVKWFCCGNTCSMRYSEQTKIFWKLGWRLFGAKFVHFMSGYKNEGECLQGLSTSPSPDSSVVNFVVPDLSVLRNFDPYGVQGERKPGMYEDIMVALNKNLSQKSACLTYETRPTARFG